MLRTLAVTTDFSDASRESFEAAASLAKTFDARLYVLHVAQDPQVVTSWQMTCETPAESKARRMTLEKKLEELVQNEGAFSRIRVEPRVVSGPSANALHEFQVAEKVDLFLTATHGYWGIKHFLLGSFAAKILRVVSCPALVFRVLKGEEEKRRHPFVPKRILAPHDFSDPSNAGLQLARAWAQAFNASVKIVHVIDCQAGEARKEGKAQESITGHYEKLQKNALWHLERLIALDWETIPVKTSTREGSPAVEILKEAEEYHPDLIVMASRGLSLQDQVAMGSVAERTIQGAPCPVLVVKQTSTT